MHAIVGVLSLVALLAAPPAQSEEVPVRLPQTVGAWSRPAQPRVITAESIFDYMNGAGEMYLAYRFERLEVFEYTAEGQGDILVELYWMEHPDDAYGLLSDDWSGEPLALGELTADSRRALYGSGYLRLAWDRLYVRVLAYDENEASRAAALELGRACVIPGGRAGRPELLELLPGQVTASGQEYAQKASSVRFFRSYLNLNVAYYLASDDILGLGPGCEVAFAEYRPPDGDHTTKVHLLMVRYPDAAAREAGARTFEAAYLADPIDRRGASPSQQTRIEAGWVGTGGTGRDLVVVFDAPAPEVAEALVLRAAAALTASLVGP
jgi:hypothetical protein